MVPRPWDSPGSRGRFGLPGTSGGTFMRTASTFEAATTHLAASSATKEAAPPYQAYRILLFGFTVAPIVAGLDKFFHLLVDWDKDLPAVANDLVGGHGHAPQTAV